ncbi:MAG: GTP cyclohydrolase IIa [Thaumarchaeota archaeon]|nr:GTP cyclohydrolase IIa [Nitrososphaerota archaeon]
MIQLSVLKIDGYGPWTLTLGSDREHELQMLQASLYKEVQRLFSARNCTVFLNRADELFAVTNGLTAKDHIDIQQNLQKSFDIRLSMSIGCADSPFGASMKAYEAVRDGDILDGENAIFGSVCSGSQDVTIMHLDVDNLTSRQKTASPYDVTCIIFGLYARMLEYFRARNSLAFFMGGDNFMVIADKKARQLAGEFIDVARDDLGILLNCGIGTAPTARQAVMLATQSLDKIREIRDSGGKKPDVYESSC